MPNWERGVGSLDRQVDARRTAVRSLASGKVRVCVQVQPQVTLGIADPANLNKQHGHFDVAHELLEAAVAII